MNFDGNALRRAYSRDGDAAENRPEEIDEVMSPRQVVGFEQEEPLLDKDYENYHSHDALLLPQAGDDLETLASHELIGDVGDMADELHTTEEIVKNALDIHGIDYPDGCEVTNNERLHDLVGNVPERLVSTESPVLIGHLYVTLGLSVGEISAVLSETMPEHNSVPEAAVSQCLVDALLIPGETSTSAKRRRRQNYGRGLTVSTRNI